MNFPNDKSTNNSLIHKFLKCKLQTTQINKLRHRDSYRDWQGLSTISPTLFLHQHHFADCCSACGLHTQGVNACRK